MAKGLFRNSTKSRFEYRAKDIYKSHNIENSITYENKKEMRFIDAISQGLFQGMEKFNNSIIMGQDIAEYGGFLKLLMDF